MGNFFFPSKRSQLAKQSAWNYGYLSELEITEEGIGLSLHPYKFDFGYHTMLQGKEKEEFLRYIACISEPIGDMKKIRELFDNWCMVSNDYVNTLATYSSDLLADGQAERVKDLRNLFTCEAHNEVLKNTLVMIYESRIEAAKEGVEYIQKLQSMEGFEV
jgi:hypothetical protein